MRQCWCSKDWGEVKTYVKSFLSTKSGKGIGGNLSGKGCDSNLSARTRNRNSGNHLWQQTWGWQQPYGMQQLQTLDQLQLDRYGYITTRTSHYNQSLGLPLTSTSRVLTNEVPTTTGRLTGPSLINLPAAPLWLKVLWRRPRTRTRALVCRPTPFSL